MLFSASKIALVYSGLLVTLLALGRAQYVSEDHQEKYSHVSLFRSFWLTSTESQAVNAASEHIRRRRATSTTSSSSCLTPQQPTNGKYKLGKFHCEDNDADCNITEGIALDPGSQLVFTCNSGYQPNGNTDVYCISNGKWTPIPFCVEVKCESLNSESTIATCTRYEKRMNCNSLLLPGTRAELRCRPGYKSDTDSITTRSRVVNCNTYGKWEPNPIRCVPACGLVTTQQKPLAIGATPARIADFPWHASLFVEINSQTTKTKQFMCGGTIIQTNLVLTAAHCVYDEATETETDATKLFVITGNIFRDYDSPLHNPEIVRKAAVKNVLVYCSYYGLQGNYNSDIALLELQHPFEYSRILLPACLDDSGYSDLQFLVPGVYGKVAGFGRTAERSTSATLQTLTVPYKSYDECKTPKYALGNRVLFSNDKFCAGYNNGSAVCEGDSGGGLVFKKGELWYVMGIVSVGLGIDTDNGERTCDKDSYTLYTRVSNYMTWIQHVLIYMERKQPFPSCNRNTNPITPMPTTTVLHQSQTTISPSVSPQNNEGESSSTQKSAILKPEEDNPTTKDRVRRGCGYRHPKEPSLKRTENKIDKAKLGSFSWRVAVTLKTSPIKEAFACIGTLIHPQAVIAIASCVSKFHPALLEIRIGVWTTLAKYEVPPYQSRNVRTVITRYENYSPSPYANDIALILLETPVELGNNVNVACLPDHNEIFVGSQCFGSGNIGLRVGGKTGTYVLENDLTVTPNEECKAYVELDSGKKEYFVLDRSFICGRLEDCMTAQVHAGSVICPMKNNTLRYVDVGLSYLRRTCNTTGEVSVAFVNLAAHRQWIDDQMVVRNLSTSTYRY